MREAVEEIGVQIAPEDVEFAHVMHNSSSGGRVAARPNRSLNLVWHAVLLRGTTGR
ncbi:hypothetical protein [Nocardia sp. NPDC057227]|uniref:hypothetical protein n=1 Tax=Nocardia sp. NPDC057227 TaxID=3346056 RepID=UPI00362FC9E9